MSPHIARTIGRRGRQTNESESWLISRLVRDYFKATAWRFDGGATNSLIHGIKCLAKWRRCPRLSTDHGLRFYSIHFVDEILTLHRLKTSAQFLFVYVASSTVDFSSRYSFLQCPSSHYTTKDSLTCKNK